MTYDTLEEAIAELRRSPERPVRAHCGDLAVEMRAIAAADRPQRIGDALAALGPWEGESAEDLMARLRQAREEGGSAPPPEL